MRCLLNACDVSSVDSKGQSRGITLNCLFTTPFNLKTEYSTNLWGQYRGPTSYIGPLRYNTRV